MNPINYNTVTRHVPPNCSIPFKLKHFFQEEREAKEPQEVNKRSQTSHERENKNLEDCWRTLLNSIKRRSSSGGRLISNVTQKKRCQQLQVVIFCSHPSFLDGHSCDTASPCIYPHTHTFVSNPNKKWIVSPNWTLGKLWLFFCCWLLFCVEWSCVCCISPGKDSHTTNITLLGTVCPLTQYWHTFMG